MYGLSHLDMVIQVGQVVTQREDHSQQHLPRVRQFSHRTAMKNDDRAIQCIVLIVYTWICAYDKG